jgi:hypothetical protein
LRNMSMTGMPALSDVSGLAHGLRTNATLVVLDLHRNG